ncbi:MAG: cyclic-di-AMP receptor [Anaerolineales bacterium]|nr:cyclic-di-AMP receptor [Anaerolineales bacterium]MDW8227426.1 cyclic-di-AMP receptor [Anaerolineales bacterium]
MERSRTITSLMTAILQEQDVDVAIRALNAVGLTAFHLATTGGFLGRRNATLLIGLPAGKESDALIALHKSCRQRIEYISTPLEGGLLALQTPLPVTVGGATVFVLPVEQYEEF